MEKLIEWGVGGNEERIFISVAYGCRYNCQYCYLREMKQVGIRKVFSAQEILDELRRKDIYVPGEQGSIISFGCYTECWDDDLKQTTIELIRYFLKKRNYVQISTKKVICDEDIREIEKDIQFKKQLNIYVSMPTLSQKAMYEPSADAIEERIKNLRFNSNPKINTCIYIKPILPEVTFQDKELYKDMAIKYGSPVVVGDMLHSKYSGDTDLIKIGCKTMQETKSEEAVILREYLKNTATVYHHSTEVISKLREEKQIKKKLITINSFGLDVDIYMPQEMQSCDMGDNLAQVQEIIAHTYRNVTVHFPRTVWIDNLIMIELFLLLCEIKRSGKEIYFDIEIDQSEVEQIRFAQYLDNYGFLKAIEKLTGEFPKEVAQYASAEYQTSPEIVRGDFSSSECFQPFTYITSREEIPQVVETVDKRIDELFHTEMTEYEVENIRFGTTAFLQETLGNVYEHAYDEETGGVCGVMIRYIHNSQRDSSIEKSRKYISLQNDRSKTKPFRNSLFDKAAHRNVASAEYNPYRNETGMNILERYLQIFVVDLGKGLLQSMGISDAAEERNVVNDIFEKGRRSDKKNRNTRYGGLGMIYRLLGEKENYISIKGIYNWISIFCGKKQDMDSTLKYVHADGYHAENTLNGIAIIGYIDSQSENIETCFLPADMKVNQIYRNQYTTQGEFKADNISFLDLRFSIPDLKNVEWKDINICFTGKNLDKGLLANRIARAVSVDNPAGKLIIADIPEREMYKYELAFKEMEVNISRVILVTQNLSAAVFESSDGKRLDYKKESTRSYIEKYDLRKPTESLAGLLSFMRFYDSVLFWNSVVKLQNSRQVHAFINGLVYWPDNKANQLDGYLDFSQTCFDDQIKSLLGYQLMRIPVGEKNRHFYSMDRFAEDICDNVNGRLAAMQGADVNECIDIGSVYVTGTSSKKSKLNVDTGHREYYYFVRESNARAGAAECDKAALLMWPNKELTGKLFKEENNLKFARLSKTPFIAEGGTAYFAKKHYNFIGGDNCSSVYVQPIDFYEIVEKESYWTNRLIKMAHFDMTDHHDLIYFNPVALFNKNIMEGGKNNIYIEKNCFDYLLLNMYRALGKSHKTDFKKAVEADIQTEYRDIVYGKLYSDNNNIPDVPGVFVYLTDYETLEIMEKMKCIFSEDTQKRIIPIAPISRSREATALLLSPILMDNIQEKIEEIKKDYGETAIATIFCATVTSTRMQREIKHILYRLGASKVRCLCIVDRQRFPLGSRAKDSYLCFCKMDLPELGAEGHGRLCIGLENLQILESELCEGPLKERCEEIKNIWRKMGPYDNHFGKGVYAKHIEFPDSVVELVNRTVKQYEWKREMQIRTDIGLVLFAIENAAATMTIDFLMCCIENSEIHGELKALLICSHLLLFENEIVEADRYSLVERLHDFLMEQDTCNEYTALVCLVVLAQGNEIRKKLFQAFYAKGEYEPFRNVDYMILYIKLHRDFETNEEYWPLCGYLESNLNEFSCLYGIFLYTFRDLQSRHGTILMTLKCAESTTPKENFISADADITFLKVAYQKMCSSYFANPADYEANRNSILDTLEEIHVLLEKGIREGLVAVEDRNQLTDTIDVFFSRAEKINEAMYMSTAYVDIRKLEKSLCELAGRANSWNVRWHINNIVYAGGNKSTRFFCYPEDLRREIQFLMEDFRYADSGRTLRGDDGNEYDAIVEVEFKEEYMVYRFKNHVKEDFSLDRVRLKKNLKRFRPTIVSLCNLLNKKNPEEIFEFSYKAEEALYSAEIKIQYLT